MIKFIELICTDSKKNIKMLSMYVDKAFEIIILHSPDQSQEIKNELVNVCHCMLCSLSCIVDCILYFVYMLMGQLAYCLNKVSYHIISYNIVKCVVIFCVNVVAISLKTNT